MIKNDTSTSLDKVSDLLQVISPEPRLQILLEIGEGEACVCHLEASLGYRQAYISQHLMALREAGFLNTAAGWQVYILSVGKARNPGDGETGCLYDRHEPFFWCQQGAHFGIIL